MTNEIQTKQLNGNGKVIERRTEIYVPHLEEVLAFGLPIEVDFCNRKKEMAMGKEDKWTVPTTAQMFSLLDLTLQNPRERNCSRINHIIDSGYFWTSTQYLIDAEGVIVYDNAKDTMPFTRKALMKMHQEGNSAIRIVPHGFKLGVQTIDEFVQNPFLIAQVGDKRMLEVVKRVAENLQTEFGILPSVDAKFISPYESREGANTGIGGCCILDPSRSKKWHMGNNYEISNEYLVGYTFGVRKINAGDKE